MKVLQINTFNNGSTGQIMRNIHKILLDNGFQSYVAYARGNELHKEDFHNIVIGSGIDIRLHGIYSRFTDKVGFASAEVTKRLIKKLKIIDPDIIHLHNLHGYYINIEELFEYLVVTGKQVVWTLHDCWSFTGHCPYFDYVGCDKWKTGCNHCPQKKEYPASFFADNSTWNYQKKKELFTSVKNMTIVTPSQWLADLVRQSFLSKYPVHVIRNGIDLNVFKPIQGDFRKKNYLENKRIVLGVASVWEPRKGLVYLLELAQKLDDTFKVVIVGVTEKQKKELPSNVLGITRTENAKHLAEIYTAADVFVNPTLEDNFPTTNLEALACGTPVVTFNTGGSPEAIDVNCGAVAERGNVDALSLAIKKIINSNSVQQVCLSKAKQFKMEDKYADYVDLYRDVMGKDDRVCIR